MTDLSNTVAIITGAVGNLGRAVANTFGAAGAKTVLVETNGLDSPVAPNVRPQT